MLNEICVIKMGHLRKMSDATMVDIKDEIVLTSIVERGGASIWPSLRSCARPS